MRKRQKGFSPVLIFILISIGVVGLLLYKKPLTTNNVHKQQEINESTASLPDYSFANFQPVSMEGWKTYTSPSYKSSYGDQIKDVMFSIKFPTDWKQGFDDKGFGLESSKYGHGFTFTKGQHEIRIALGYAPGGNLCVFDDSTELNTPETSPQSYGDVYHKQYTEISSGFSTLRRIYYSSDSQDKDIVKFNICSNEANKQKTQYNDNTSLGRITYTVPKDFTQSDLQIMDTILSTINKS